MSVLLTVNIVSHNQARNSSDNIPSQPPDNHHNWDVVQRWKVKLAGNMTASMRTNYNEGLMNNESYSRCTVYIILSCCTYIHFIV